MFKNFFKKGVDFQRSKCEIATKQLSRQTVLSAESSTGKSLLSASGVLPTPSLEIAQRFPSAYFKKHYPEVVPSTLGFFVLLSPVNIFCYSPFVKLKIKCFLTSCTCKKIT
jgi:hypothetical protein